MSKSELYDFAVGDEDGMTEDQKWCADRAKFCEERGAPTVAKLLRDAATDPSKATICREEMNRAAQGVKAIRRSEK